MGSQVSYLLYSERKRLKMEQRLHPVLQEIQDFCNRNLNGKISTDVAEMLLIRVSRVIEQMQKAQAEQPSALAQGE
mgnify:CR=1 FL=1